MNVWKSLTIQQLETIHEKRCAVRVLEEQMAQVTEDLMRIPASRTDRIVVTQTKKWDDHFINLIALKEEYNANLGKLQGLVRVFDIAWAELTEEEQTLLEVFFVNKQKMAAAELSERLNVEARHIYRLRDNALARFALLFYGKELCA